MTADQMQVKIRYCPHFQVAAEVARSTAEAASSESGVQVTKIVQCKFKDCTVSASSTAIDGEEEISRYQGGPCVSTGDEPMS